MSADTTVITPEIIREVVVADIIEARPDRPPPRVLPAQPAEAEVLEAMDELLGRQTEVEKAAKTAKTWTVWVSCYKVGYVAPHGHNSMNFLFQRELAKHMPRFDIVKLDAETWVFKPDPKGLRTLHVRGGRGRVTVLDEAAPFRSVAVPLVEVDGVFMAHIPITLRQAVGTGDALMKRKATIARKREEAAAEAKRATEFQNRHEAQKARYERERERKLGPPLDQQQAKDKLVQPSRLAQAMREFAAPIEPAKPAQPFPPAENGPVEPLILIGDLRKILQRINRIEATTPYRISRVKNEDGSTALVWKAPNITA